MYPHHNHYAALSFTKRGRSRKNGRRQARACNVHPAVIFQRITILTANQITTFSGHMWPFRMTSSHALLVARQRPQGVFVTTTRFICDVHIKPSRWMSVSDCFHGWLDRRFAGQPDPRLRTRVPGRHRKWGCDHTVFELVHAINSENYVRLVPVLSRAAFEPPLVMPRNGSSLLQLLRLASVPGVCELIPIFLILFEPFRGTVISFVYKCRTYCACRLQRNWWINPIRKQVAALGILLLLLMMGSLIEWFWWWLQDGVCAPPFPCEQCKRLLGITFGELGK